MTLREVGSAVIYLGGLAVALVAIGTLLRVTIVNPLRRRIQQEVAAAVRRHERAEHRHRHNSRGE